MSKLVSIIIPVYKSELTLSRCVESVLNQTYQNVEAILVVDGPPDGSGILAEELARTDERVRVINQSNQGVSKARNTGISEARGEYIRFLDSDDYMQKDSVMDLVTAIEEANCDLVIAGYHHLYFGKTITKIPSVKGRFITAQAPKEMKQLYCGGFLNMPWNKLFKRELIEEGFPVGISLGEDLMFNQNYIAKTNSFTVIDSCVCEYIQDDRGTTLSTKKRDDKIETAILLYQKSSAFFKSLYGDELEDSFLAQKVVTTFLDDVEQVGFSDMTSKEKKAAYRSYETAICDFVSRQKQKPQLTLLDYKIIYFFLIRKQTTMVHVMVALRTLVVKLVRKAE